MSEPEEVFPDHYTFMLTTKCACPNGCPLSTKSKTSIGSTLCILLLVIVLVYFIGGGLLLKYHKKEEGIAIIPNHSLWVELPGLIKDGFLFTKEKLKKNPNEYQEI